MDSINRYIKRLQKPGTLNLVSQLSNNLGLSFAAFYFKLHGVELYKIVLIWAISPMVSLPVVYFINRFNTKTHLQLGTLAYVGMALSLLFYGSYSFLFYGIFIGLTLGFFWPSFNYHFFSQSDSSNHAKDSSVYFTFGPLVGVVLPPIGAIIIGNFGFRVLFFITALLALLPLLYIKGKTFDTQINQKFSTANQSFSGLRLITFFDGALHYFQGSFLAVYVLLFLKTEYQVGALLSYLALASLVVSFLLSHISDRTKKKTAILYPLLVTMGVLIMSMPAFKTLVGLTPIIGAYVILDNLSLPIRFAVPLELAKTDVGFWRVNEFYGNTGRTIVFGAAALLLYVGNKWAAFAVFSIMTLAFPFIISQKVKSLT